MTPKTPDASLLALAREMVASEIAASTYLIREYVDGGLGYPVSRGQCYGLARDYGRRLRAWRLVAKMLESIDARDSGALRSEAGDLPTASAAPPEVRDGRAPGAASAGCASFSEAALHALRDAYGWIDDHSPEPVTLTDALTRKAVLELGRELRRHEHGSALPASVKEE